jgi:hypothetical protein
MKNRGAKARTESPVGPRGIRNKRQWHFREDRSNGAAEQHVFRTGQKLDSEWDILLHQQISEILRQSVRSPVISHHSAGQ